MSQAALHEDELDPETAGGVGHSWFLVVLETEPVEPEPEPPAPQVGGASSDFAAVSGVPVHIGRPQIFRFDGHYEVRGKKVVARFPVGHFLNRKKTVNFAAQAELVRTYTFTFGAVRGPAEHWNRLLREDDEMMLFLEGNDD